MKKRNLVLSLIIILILNGCYHSQWVRTDYFVKKTAPEKAKVVKIMTISGKEIKCTNKSYKQSHIKGEFFFYYTRDVSIMDCYSLVLNKIPLKNIKAFYLRIPPDLLPYLIPAALIIGIIYFPFAIANEGM